ncbi:MAG TPA: hypothetical protein VM324_00035 [Egibacteraceae bacterium]|nr:hypothetical protein [Egibacteraceae bacterium]
MRVVIIGPGKIGAGYLAPLFEAAGWHVTLAARTAETAARIDRLGRFVVTEVAAPPSPAGPREPARRQDVVGVRAVAIGSEDFRGAVADADLVCTAVGVGKVRGLAEPLADALAIRPPSRPLDVWVVENGDCAGALATDLAAAAAARHVTLPRIGVAGAVASVAVGRGSWGDPAPEFVGDDARRLAVDTRTLTTPLPILPGVTGTGHYKAALLGKLHVFNAGHAICAYLGWLRGHETVDQAIADPVLRPMVAGSMLESQRALLALFPELGADAHAPVADALRRFANDRLADPIPRVARDPLRKLAPADRLVGPMLAIHQATGTIPAYFTLGIAGALLYRHRDDHQAAELQQRLATFGVMAFIAEVCGLDSDDPLARAVASRYRGFIFTDDGVLFPPAYQDAPVSSAGAR